MEDVEDVLDMEDMEDVEDHSLAVTFQPARGSRPFSVHSWLNLDHPKPGGQGIH